MRLTNLLDNYLEIYEQKNMGAKNSLLTPDEKGHLQRLFPNHSLPEELLELYSWRNGNRELDSLSNLKFRDQSFLSIENAKLAYENLVPFHMSEDEDYISLPEVITLHGANLYECFPIAGNQDDMYMVVCGAHELESHLANPVIGVSPASSEFFFDSIASMVMTCAEWISTKEDSFTPLPDSIEYTVWEKYNPITYATWGSSLT